MKAAEQTPTWKQVAQDPEFQQADWQTRQAVRAKFFDRYVRSVAPEGRLEELQSRFFTETEADVFGRREETADERSARTRPGAIAERAEAPEEMPGMLGNSMRKAGERGLDLGGNFLDFVGGMAERGEALISEKLGGLNPGVIGGDVETMRERGYEPDVSIGDYGLDFTARAKPEDTNLGIQAAGEAIEDVSLGYQPNYTIDRALDNPTPGNLLGAVAEEGPSALVDMAGIAASFPAYLMARTEEIADQRVENDKRTGDPTRQDYAWALPGATLSAALDRFSLTRLLPRTGRAVTRLRQVPGAMLRGGLTEAGTEAVQEGGIEYIAETADTATAPTVEGGLRRAAGGALIGGPIGGGVRGVTASAEALLKENPDQVAEALETTVEEADQQATQTAETLIRSPRSALDPDARAARDDILDGEGFKTLRAKAERLGLSDAVRDLDVARAQAGEALEAETLARAEGAESAPEAVQATLDQAAQRYTRALDAVLKGAPVKPRVRVRDGRPLGADGQPLDLEAMSEEERNAAWEALWRDQGVAEPAENVPDTTIDIQGRPTPVEDATASGLATPAQPPTETAQTPAEGLAMPGQASTPAPAENAPEAAPAAPEAPVVDQPRDTNDVVSRPAPEMNDKPAERKASVPTMITQRMRRQLGELGYTADQVRKMKPREAWDTIQAGEPTTRAKVEAAGTETNVTPSEAQIEADNYKKGRVRLDGLEIAIENPKGSTRRGTDPDGNTWESTLAHHYGDIKGTRGADGDNVDIFIGDAPDSDRVFVIDQVNADGTFDETKVMTGFRSEAEARRGYLANYPKGWQGIGAVTETTKAGLKEWVRDGATELPFGEVPTRQEVTYERATRDVSGGERDSGPVYEAVRDVQSPTAVPGVAAPQPATRQRAQRTAKRQLDSNLRLHYELKSGDRIPVGIDRVASAEDVAHLVAPLRKRAQENMMAVVTDSRGKVLSLIRHSLGNRNSASVYIDELVASAAMVPGGKKIWLSHNHPSGSREPSSADYQISDRIEQALDASGLIYEGHVVNAAGGQFTAFGERDGRRKTRKAARPVKPTLANRKATQGIDERVLTRRAPADRPQVNSPDAAIATAEDLEVDQGVVLLDNQHYPIGVLAFSDEQMANLRQGGNAKRLLQAIGQSNASAMVVVSRSPGAAVNVMRYINNLNQGQAGVRVLDGLVGSEGNRVSLAEMDRTDQSNTTFYRQGGRTGIYPSEARAAIQPLREEGLDAMVADTVEQLPKALRERIAADGVADRVSGVYYQGTAWLVASNLASPEEATRTVLHEVVGHAGVRKLLGDGLDPVLDAIYRDMPRRRREELEASYAEVLDRQTRAQARRTVAEEHLAHLAEIQPQHTWVSRVVSLMRRFLRRTFGDRVAKQWGRREIVDLLQQARTVANFRYRGGRGDYMLRLRELGGYEAELAKDGTLTVFGDASEIREKLPNNFKGRVVRGGLRFTANQATQARNALTGRKNAYSRGGEVVNKLPMKGGKYVGAPERFNTPGKIPKLRRILRQLAEEGEPGRMWYENSGKAVLHLVGGDLHKARQFVALLSIYSPQAKVDSNGTFALRAWAQYEAGKPIHTKTRVQDVKAEKALANVEEFWSGEKTGNFFFNLLREIDPSTEGSQGATIDMWMMRAAQYDHDAPTTTEYAFMENETNRVARDLGWEPQQVQAAIWVAMKARMENPEVKRRTEAISEKKGWIHYTTQQKNGRAVKTRVVDDPRKHMQNWVDQAMAHDLTYKDTDQAKFDFADSLARHIGQVSWEPRPSTSVPILPGVHDAPYEQQLEFEQAVKDALYDDNGTDLLAAKLGLLVEDVVPGPGVWESTVSAGGQTLVPMAPTAGKDVTGIDPDQKTLLDAYAATLGWLLRQDGVGYHRPFYKSAKRDHNALELRIGRGFTAEEAETLWAAVDSLMRERGHTEWESGAGLVASPDGMRVINFGAFEDNNAFRAMVIEAAEATDIEATIDPVSFMADGDLQMNDWQENPNGEGFARTLRDAGRPDLLPWAAGSLGPRIQAVFNDFSERYGWGDPGRLPATDAALEEVTPARYRLTETPAFRRWFDGSQVVDASGAPKIVYHGTQQDFATFSRDWFGEGNGNTDLGEGFYFTDTPDAASTYADGPGGNVMPVYLAIRSPADMDVLLSDDVQLAMDDDMGFDDFADVLEGMGYDGVMVEREGGTEYLALRPGQIKSAIGNVGTYDPANDDIRYKLKKTPLGEYSAQDATNFAMPDEGWRDLALRKMADKMLPLKRLEEVIRARGGDVNEDNDAYLAEEAFHGKTERDLDLLEKRHVEPLAEALTEAGITQAQLDEFLYARHAPERNAVIAERNPGNEAMQDGGSGMTNERAREILQRVADSGRWGTYEALAERVYAMLRLQREAIRDGGLEGDETLDAWEAMYDYYVPLKGWAQDENVPPGQDASGRPRTGKGFEIRGREARTALGRTTEAASPSTQAIVDTTQSLIRRRKNEVGNALLSLVTDNPNPDLWQVFTDQAPDTQRSHVTRTDPETGQSIIEVVERPVQMDQNPRYFKTKRYGRTYYIKLNDERLMNAMRNVGPEQNNAFIRLMGGAVRIMSSLVTSYNPEFLVTNFLRDIQTAMFNVLAEETREDGKIRGRAIARQVAHDVRPAMRAAYRGLAGKKTKKPSDRLWDQWFEEFRADGAKTGYFDMKDLRGQAKAIEAIMRRSRGGTVGQLLKARKATADYVENLNGAVENAIRLSAYVNARKAGVSRKRASSLAKNLTVNFNRRGEVGTALNAFYMFANASIQGTMNVARTMIEFKEAGPGRHPMNVWSRLNLGQKMAFGMATGAFMLAMANRWLSDEDDDGELYWDKIPDHVKERNLIIMTGGQDYVRIPMPYGYNVFGVLGTHAEAVLSGNAGPLEALKNVGLAALGSFSPIGFEDSDEVDKLIGKNLTPTLFRSISQVVANEDFAARPVYKEAFPFGTPTPDSARSFRSTPEPYKDLARILNDVTGGSEYRSGWADVSPDTLQHLVNYYGGGAWAFTEKTADALKRLATGEEIEKYRIPFAGRVVSDVSEYGDIQTFYERRKEVGQLAKEFENLPADEVERFYAEHGDKIDLFDMATDVAQVLTEMREARTAIEADESLSRRERRELLDVIEEAMDAEVDVFNRFYNDAEE